MSCKAVYTKTAKGLREATGKTNVLRRDLLSVLKKIDGKTAALELLPSLKGFSETELQSALLNLVDGDYIRVFVPATIYVLPEPAKAAESAGGDSPALMEVEGISLDFTNAESESLDFTANSMSSAETAAGAKSQEAAASRIEIAQRDKQESELLAKAEQSARLIAIEKARREAEEKARLAAEEKARREAEEKARLAAEEKTRREVAEKARLAAEEKARREAEEKARLVAEEKARREAAERARLAAEEKARREAAEKARLAAEEKARREAEEKARLAAEEKARREAEEKARLAAEEKARREAEEKARLAAEAEARREAAERARLAAEEKARREAEEKARFAAEERARREAEEMAKAQARLQAEAEEAERLAEERARRQAQRDAEEIALRERSLQREAEMQAVAPTALQADTKPYRKPVPWFKTIAIGSLVLIMAGLGLIHVVPFDTQRSLFEKTATGLLRQPVTIRELHLSLLPRLHWRLEGIAIGSQGQIKVAQLKATPVPGTLFSDNSAFTELELDTAALSEEGLGWLLFGMPDQKPLRLPSIMAKNIKLESKNMALPVVDAKIDIGEDGKWRLAHIEAAGEQLRMELKPMAGSVQIDINAASYRLPLGSALVIKDLQATAQVNPGDLALTDFSGHLYGGVVRGNARLKWGASWSLDADLSAKQIDVASLAPGLAEEGKLEGRALYSSRATDGDKLFAAQRLNGSFVVGKGTLLGLDFGKLFKDERGSGGKSAFREIAGNFAVDNASIQLRQVRLDAGVVSASGDVRLNAEDKLQGRFAVGLKSPTVQRHLTLGLSGTLKEPRFDRQ